MCNEEDTSINWENFSATITCGTVSAVNGYIALDNLLEYIYTKAIALQIEAVKMPTFDDKYSGLFHAAVAGLTGGMALYYSCREKK